MEKCEMSHKYILVGSSGVGKSSMAECLKELGLKRCTTCTTRPPRPGELEKQEYYFFEFPETMCSLDLFEQSEFGGHLYGITRDELGKGDFVILEPQGVEFYRENYPGPLTVILLEREGINVDPERRARDIAAGFDKVNPDITVRGETIEEMQENLVAAIRSFELHRYREEDVSYLPNFPGCNHIEGSAVLCFQDSEFDLPVSAMEHHYSYRHDLPAYDGVACFEAADYERLCVVFCALAEKGRECTFDFYTHGEGNQLLYVCHLNNEDGKIVGELSPYYLGMEPLHFETDSPVKALDIASGGFLAAENDLIGWDHLNSEKSKAVQTYRAALAEGRFVLHQKDEKHPSLNSRIRKAAAISKVHLEKLSSSKELTWDGCVR